MLSEEALKLLLDKLSKDDPASRIFDDESATAAFMIEALKELNARRMVFESYEKFILSVAQKLAKDSEDITVISMMLKELKNLLVMTRATGSGGWTLHALSDPGPLTAGEWSRTEWKPAEVIEEGSWKGIPMSGWVDIGACPKAGPLADPSMLISWATGTSIETDITPVEKIPEKPASKARELYQKKV